MPSAVLQPSTAVADVQAGVAEYIAQMSSELAGLASTSNLGVLQQVLNMAAMEAGQRAREHAFARNTRQGSSDIEARQKERRGRPVAA